MITAKLEYGNCNLEEYLNITYYRLSFSGDTAQKYNDSLYDGYYHSPKEIMNMRSTLMQNVNNAEKALNDKIARINEKRFFLRFWYTKNEKNTIKCYQHNLDIAIERFENFDSYYQATLYNEIDRLRQFLRMNGFVFNRRTYSSTYKYRAVEIWEKQYE